MNIWVVRAGRNGEYEDMALRLEITSIDWNALMDMSHIYNRDALRILYQKVYPEESKNQVAAGVGQVWSFLSKMSINDGIIMPLKRRPGLAIGRIVGHYQYRTDVPARSYQTRNVKWGKIVQRSYFNEDVQNSLCGHLTVFQLKNNDIEEKFIELLGS
jgi:restriction system protein